MGDVVDVVDELARSEDPLALVFDQNEQVAIAGHDELGFTSSSGGEDLVVIWIARHARNVPRMHKYGDLFVLGARGGRHLGWKLEAAKDLVELTHETRARNDLELTAKGPLKQLTWQASE